MAQHELDLTQATSLEPALFEVKTVPVGYWDERNYHFRKILGFNAIVPIDDNGEIYNKPFSVVTANYTLVTNQEAINIAERIVPILFPGADFKKDFMCIDLAMPTTAGSCRMTFVYKNKPFPFDGGFAKGLSYDSKMKVDEYYPFVRISNSYNRTLRLTLTIGFVRRWCTNGCVETRNSVSFSIDHTNIEKELRQWERFYRNSGQNITQIWTQMENRFKRLQNIPMNLHSALGMFVKVFDVKADQRDEKELIRALEEAKSYAERKSAETKLRTLRQQRALLSQRAHEVEQLVQEYEQELGKNAYALFNVLTAWASRPVGVASNPMNIHGYQRKVSAWVDDFLSAHDKPNFSLNQFIGSDNLDTADFIAALPYVAPQTPEENEQNGQTRLELYLKELPSIK